MGVFSDPQIWAAFLTLVIMEIVLGIDNIVFITLLTGRLPSQQQRKGRILRMSLALLVRILLLISISWVMTLTAPLFNPTDWLSIHTGPLHQQLDISGRDLILISGGYSLYKSNKEIYESLEGVSRAERPKSLSLWHTILQIGLLDIVFGLDSVITAIGMSDHLGVMIAAVVVAMFFMLLASRGLSTFVNEHPSVKLLALAFLLLIGVSLIAEGIDQPIAKGHIYFAMGFSIFVEILILKWSKIQTEATIQHQQKIKESAS